MITITDLCEIGKIIIGSIEGGLIEKKITTVSQCVSDLNIIHVLVKCYLFRSGESSAGRQQDKPWYQVSLA